MVRVLLFSEPTVEYPVTLAGPPDAIPVVDRTRSLTNGIGRNWLSDGFSEDKIIVVGSHAPGFLVGQAPAAAGETVIGWDTGAGGRKAGSNQPSLLPAWAGVVFVGCWGTTAGTMAPAGWRNQASI
jgi:hypothetical protein